MAESTIIVERHQATGDDESHKLAEASPKEVHKEIAFLPCGCFLDNIFDRMKNWSQPEGIDKCSDNTPPLLEFSTRRQLQKALPLNK